MTRLAFRLSYIGTRFFGSQIQADCRTVEGAVITACRELGLFSDWREARFAPAGRTDRGVHARGQVFAISTDQPERAVSTINLLLPRDCWCTGWAEVDEDFHPRYDAITRTYRYYFPDPELDISAMQKGADAFQGRHDFSRFSRPSDRDPVRTIFSASILREDSFTVFEVCGKSFLWNMVRCMACILREIGNGEREPQDITELLKNPEGRRISAAPPGNLILWDVDCETEFTPLPMDKRSLLYTADLKKELCTQKKMIDLIS